MQNYYAVILEFKYMLVSNVLSKRVSKWSNGQVTLLIAIAAFCCYTSMYAFRKSFTAGDYEGEMLFGMSYKVCMVITQMFGYLLSKFYGIRYIAESTNNKRGRSLIVLVGLSWFGLLGFALAPKPWNIMFLFLNGLPLGMIWGLVFSYLEGRRHTEIMGAIMAVSLVFASGLVKTVGRMLMDTFPIDEYWMPFCTGLVFFLPFLLTVWLLEQVPAPSVEDKACRTERVPMDKAMRNRFLKTYLPGIILTVIIYTMLTMLRDVRDNFEVEIWQMLEVQDNSIYAKVDGIIAIVVLVSLGLLILVKNNLKAFQLIHGQIIVGFAIAGISTYFFTQKSLDGTLWMILVGLGLYMAYIPYNVIFFERMIATFRERGNIGFVMYIADSIGYLGSFSILLNKEFMPSSIGWGSYFIQLVLIASVLGIALTIVSFFYFTQKKKQHALVSPDEVKAWSMSNKKVEIQMNIK